MQALVPQSQYSHPKLSADNLIEGYNYLRAVVMAYGDISPESPLSLTSGSQQTTQQTTSVSTSERTTPQHDTGTHTPSTYDPFEKPPVYDYHSSNKEILQNIQNVSKSWARPHSSLSQSEVTGSRPFSGDEGQWRQGTCTPVSVQKYLHTKGVLLYHSVLTCMILLVVTRQLSLKTMLNFEAQR